MGEITDGGDNKFRSSVSFYHLLLRFRITCQVNFSPSGNARAKKQHDDKDDSKAPNGDNGKGSGEDVNSGLVENGKDGPGDKPDTLGHHGEQGEGSADLVSVDQLGDDGVGDFLNRPVERKEESG